MTMPPVDQPQPQTKTHSPEDALGLLIGLLGLLGKSTTELVASLDRIEPALQPKTPQPALDRIGLALERIALALETIAGLAASQLAEREAMAARYSTRHRQPER